MTTTVRWPLRKWLTRSATSWSTPGAIAGSLDASGESQKSEDAGERGHFGALLRVLILLWFLLHRVALVDAVAGASARLIEIKIPKVESKGLGD